MTAARRAPYRVVEVTTGVAGAVTGRLFAGLGNEVVSVELGPDSRLRKRPPLAADGTGLRYRTLTADKRIVRLPDAAAVAAALPAMLAQADVLVTDVTPTVAASLGLVDDILRHSYPELVTVWVSAFGRTGELAELEGDSLLAEALGGLATMIGTAGRRPLTLGGEQIAHCAGVVGFLGVLLALMRRDSGHGGDIVDVVMSDVAAYADWKSDVVLSLTGSAPGRAKDQGGEWKMLRASDGWVGAIFQQQHWGAMIELVDHPALRDPELANEAVRLQRAHEWWPVVDKWAASRTTQEIYGEAQRLGLPFGWAVKASDIVRSEQLRGRGFILADDDYDGSRPVVGTPAFCSDLPWHSGTSVTAASRELRFAAPALFPAPGGTASGETGLPLEGLVVLDFGAITAGAAVTRILADFGATVLKVESADRPDTFRTWKMPEDLRAPQDPADPRQGSPYFPSNNVGKRAIAVDLKTEEGRRVIHELAACSHVFVENFRVGVAERLGIDEPTLRAINPDLLYVSLSSQGQTGPESRNRSFGSTLDLLSGLASFTGYEPDQPMWSSSDVNWPDQLVSLVGAAFLVYSLATGLRGSYLDISQREVVSWTLAAEIADFSVNGVDSRITGNRRPGAAPHDTYATAGQDSWIAVSCTQDAEREGLARCLGAEELLGRDAAWWESNQDRVDELLRRWTATRTRDDAAGELRVHGVPSVPVLTAEDRAAMPEIARRLVRLTDGDVPIKGFPMTFRELRLPIRMHAPLIGEDTVEVLRSFTGLSDAEIDDLRERRAIFVGGAAAPANR